MDTQTNQAIVERRTREEILQIVAEYASSDMPPSEFCRTRGISRSTLDRHLRRQRGQNRATGTSMQWLPVKLKTSHESLPACSGGLIVALKSGHKIEVQRGFDVATLERLLNILEGV